uniref:Uncharacterized protein n=1 Tax=Lotharella oceanica TaxID=641309 RepID=A0A7S2X7D3_9EUKA
MQIREERLRAARARGGNTTLTGAPRMTLTPELVQRIRQRDPAAVKSMGAEWADLQSIREKIEREGEEEVDERSANEEKTIQSLLDINEDGIARGMR